MTPVGDELVLVERIRSVGAELRRDLGAVVEGAAPPPPRPAQLSRSLGVDISLTSRLIRGLKAQDPLGTISSVTLPFLTTR